MTREELPIIVLLPINLLLFLNSLRFTFIFFSQIFIKAFPS